MDRENIIGLTVKRIQANSRIICLKAKEQEYIVMVQPSLEIGMDGIIATKV